MKCREARVEGRQPVRRLLLCFDKFWIRVLAVTVDREGVPVGYILGLEFRELADRLEWRENEGSRFLLNFYLE